MKEKVLIERIEDITCQRYDSPKDFARLSDLIYTKTKERLSPTTLKRLWGYINSSCEPRTYTLDVLARFVGYKDFESFQGEGQSEEVQSDIAICNKISCDELPMGEVIRLSWLPNRVCLVRHEGHGRFRVIESRNSKLAEDDTFTCLLIINHEPLFLDKLMHKGKGPYVYVAGKKDGVTVEKVPLGERMLA